MSMSEPTARLLPLFLFFRLLLLILVAFLFSILFFLVAFDHGDNLARCLELERSHVLIIVLLLLGKRAVDTSKDRQRVLVVAALRRNSQSGHGVLVARQVELDSFGNLIALRGI